MKRNFCNIGATEEPVSLRCKGEGSVAEWSKALVSGTSHYDGVGSNPTTAIRAGCFVAKILGEFETIFVVLIYDSGRNDS